MKLLAAASGSGMLGLFLLLPLGACQLPQLSGAGAASATAEPTDAELRQRYGDEVASDVANIRSKHQAALAAPTSLDAADAYADALIAGMHKNYAQINGIDWRKYTQDGSDLLGGATTAAGSDAERTANALAKRAILQYSLGDEANAVVSIRAGFAKAPTYLSSLGMVGVYRGDKQPEEAKRICEKARPLAPAEDDVYQLMAECLKLNEGEAPEQTLPWASKPDWELYKRRSQEQVVRNLARREAEQQADADARATRDANANTNANPEPERKQRAEPDASGPKYASFTLRNSCRETVKVFYGQTPKFGSGRSSTVSGNSQQNENMREGDLLWIVDASGNGVSSYTASASTHEVIINEACTGFQAR
jgi:hypothetical protein